MNDELNLKKPLDLNEWAYMSIKMRILDHEIEPGSQLNIEELSKELNISRTPIREALLRLKQTGLVVSASRVGFFVCGITKEDFENIFELRQLIEAYAAEKAAANMTDKEITALVRLNERCKAMIERGKIKEYNQYETQLHDAIIDSLGNNKIREVMNSVGDLLYRIRIIAMGSLENINFSILEHQKFISAIKDRNPEAAHKAMGEHIFSVKNRLKQIVDFQD